MAVFTTPFSWLEAYTPRERWLGRDGEESFEVMREAMEKDGAFELIDRYPVPLLIREHKRKYQYIVADGSVWRRK
jgi:hypothetical protein